jgi:hypothetical protein
MHRLVLTAPSAEDLVRSIGENLVDVHVVRRAGARLIGIDDEMLAMLSRQHFICSGDYRVGQSRFEACCRLVRDRGRALDAHRRVDERGKRPESADRKVLHRPQCLHAVQRVRRHGQLAKRILFDSGVLGHLCARNG